MDSYKQLYENSKLEHENLKKEKDKVDVDLKQAVDEKEKCLKNIIQIKKLARRYKTQNDELNSKIKTLEISKGQTSDSMEGERVKVLEEKITQLESELEGTKLITEERLKLKTQLSDANEKLHDAESKYGDVDKLINSKEVLIVEANSRIEQLEKEVQSLKDQIKRSNTENEKLQNEFIAQKKILEGAKKKLNDDKAELNEMKDYKGKSQLFSTLL